MQWLNYNGVALLIRTCAVVPMVFVVGPMWHEFNLILMLSPLTQWLSPPWLQAVPRGVLPQAAWGAVRGLHSQEDQEEVQRHLWLCGQECGEEAEWPGGWHTHAHTHTHTHIHTQKTHLTHRGRSVFTIFNVLANLTHFCLAWSKICFFG